MPLSNAEKQKRYRERHLGPDGTKARLHLIVDPNTAVQLKRLARYRGCGMAVVIEPLVAAAERAVLRKLTPTQKREYLA